jgi:hypothetical protein
MEEVVRCKFLVLVAMVAGNRRRFCDAFQPGAEMKWSRFMGFGFFNLLMQI